MIVENMLVLILSKNTTIYFEALFDIINKSFE